MRALKSWIVLKQKFQSDSYVNSDHILGNWELKNNITFNDSFEQKKEIWIDNSFQNNESKKMIKKNEE